MMTRTLRLTSRETKKRQRGKTFHMDQTEERGKNTRIIDGKDEDIMRVKEKDPRRR